MVYLRLAMTNRTAPEAATTTDTDEHTHCERCGSDNDYVVATDHGLLCKGCERIVNAGC